MNEKVLRNVMCTWWMRKPKRYSIASDIVMYGVGSNLESVNDFLSCSSNWGLIAFEVWDERI